MGQSDTFKVKILTSPSKNWQKWYLNNYKLAPSGTITFRPDYFEIYYPIKTIALHKIEKIQFERSGFLGKDKWLTIAYTENKKEKKLRFHCGIFGQSIQPIINRLNKFQ